MRLVMFLLAHGIAFVSFVVTLLAVVLKPKKGANQEHEKMQ